jgi:succinate dehydrogenase/fumarate reductase flavoprotein subunit
MTSWHELIEQDGRTIEWPYPIRYEQEQTIDTDVLIVGGGIAGCRAAISAAQRKGLRVAIVEKAATIRSGAGGPGGNDWENPMTSPYSNMSPEERCQQILDGFGGYNCGIGRYIQCREGYDAFLELEPMGGKIRDSEDEFVGCWGRDDKTKFVRGERYQPVNADLQFWGSTLKPVLKKECERLGVKIYDRVMCTSLLNEKGIQGSRVAGATGLNTRTGEFMIFKARAVVLCTAGIGSVWVFNTELAGICTFRSRNNAGDGTVMAFRAGAAVTQMEKSGLLTLGTGFKHHWYAGIDAGFEHLSQIDDNGKPIPERGNVREAVLKGELALPFWGDLPALSERWRKINWDLLYKEESTTKAIRRKYMEAGFDPAKDLFPAYTLLEGTTPANFRSSDSMSARGGVVVDWDLMTTLDGLFAAGEQMYGPGDHSYAESTGRYAGRKAADYAQKAGEPAISRNQVALEKTRVYAPIKRNQGIDWKELHAGISRNMQYFCSEYKNERLLTMGLDALQDIEKNWVPQLFALDPHKLVRSLEDLSLLTFSQLIIHASLARKASSRHLNFQRIDFPEMDPPEWAKWITLKSENGKVKIGELPLAYWGDLKTNYEAHNKGYVGSYEEKSWTRNPKPTAAPSIYP